MVNAAVSWNMAERLQELGGIPADRVRMVPAPGTATLEDLYAVNAKLSPLCELIDHTLVEKAMGFESSVVAMAIATILRNFVAPRKLGVVSGPDGLYRLVRSSARGPDVAYLSWQRFPSGKFPVEAYPALAPNLAIEVLSPGNTKAEMSRKRIEYFHSGVELVWIVDCSDRSVAVYSTSSSYVVVNEGQTIDGGSVLAGFTCPVADFFSDLGLQPQQSR